MNWKNVEIPTFAGSAGANPTFDVDAFYYEVAV